MAKAQSNPNQSSQNQLSDDILKRLGVTNPDERIQGHGKSVREIRELHEEQRLGEHAMINANKNSKIKIQDADKHRVHVLLETPRYHEQTGKKLSKPRLANFDEKDFFRMVKERAFLGQTVQIVHDPRTSEAKAKQPIDEIVPPPAQGLDALTEKQMHDLYVELYEEEPDVLSTPDEIKDKVKEKQAFIEAEKK